MHTSFLIFGIQIGIIVGAGRPFKLKLRERFPKGTIRTNILHEYRFEQYAKLFFKHKKVSKP